jgi:hypothetical protein
LLNDEEGISALSAFIDKPCTVTYTRSFTKDRPSTVCLPFDYAPKSGEMFYTFTGITMLCASEPAVLCGSKDETTEEETWYEMLFKIL